MANGQVTTSAQGSVIKGLSIALIGLALTAAQGTMSGQGSNASAALTGQSSTVSAGNVTPSAACALTGWQANFSQGAIFANGRSLVQSSQGTVAPSNTSALTGQVVTGGTGLITPNAAGTLPLVGSSITATAGILLAPGSQALTGLASTASPGSMGLTLRPTDPIGQSITSAQGSVGILANNVTVNITGYEITSQQGFVDSTPVLASQVMTSAAGAMVSTIQLPLVGGASTLSQGTLQVDQGASEDTYIQSVSGTPGLSSTVPLTGIASTTASGTMSISADVLQPLTGSASTSATGLMIPTPLLALVGESLQSAQGNVGAPGSATLTGQVITSQQGALFITGDRTQALSGLSSALANGTLVARPQIPLTGTVLQSSSGQLGRSGGNMALALMGQSSTGNTGTLGVTGQSVTLPGVSNEGCSIVSGIAEETEASPVAVGTEGCSIQSRSAKEVESDATPSSTNILDTFSRADEDPLANGTWSAFDAFYPGARLVSGTARASTGIVSRSAWSAAQFGPACEVFCTVTTRPAPGDYLALWLRLDGLGTAFWPGAGYRAQFINAGTNNLMVDLYRYAGGNPVSIPINSVLVGTWDDGDVVGLSVDDQNLFTVWKQTGSGSRVILASATDTGLVQAGYIGMEFADTTLVLEVDNFGGGSL